MATTTPEERAEAARMRGGGGAGAGVLPADIPPLDIQPGTQKYVLIEISGGAAYLVRGNPRAEYHKDAAGPTVRQLQAAGIQYEVMGGGRIRYDSAEGTVLIYGFSYGFPWDGAPRHDLAADVVQQHLPGVSVETSDEGY